jgi:hypothetical protein
MSDQRVADDFDDVDPEDAWDADDDLDQKLALLPRIVESIEQEHAQHGSTSRHAVRVENTDADVAALLFLRTLPPGAREHLEALAERLGALRG